MKERNAASSRLVATLALLATFALGMIAGGVLLHIGQRSLHAWHRLGVGPPPGVPPIEHLGRALNLSEDQTAKIRAIFGESRERMHAEVDSTREKIRRILTPEQQTRFDPMRPPLPPPPPPPPPGSPGEGFPPGPQPGPGGS